MIKPRRLKAGHRVAAVTLSWGGPGAILHRYEAGKMQLEREFGVRVVEMRHTLRPPEWIARNPKARADDLMEAFADPAIDGIISAVGGEDSVRALPYMDLDVIRRHPKVVMGYSDTTITHIACFNAGLVSFYGPSIMASFAENGGLFPYMTQSVRKTLFSADPIGIIEPNKDGWTAERLEWANPENQRIRRKLVPASGWKFLQGEGVVTGPLIGGCADILEFLKGTPWWPRPERWQGAILFLETSEEAPSPTLFKDWLRNYASQGILQRLAGILVGRPGGASVSPDSFEAYDKMLLKIVRDEVGLTSMPIISRMDFGHTDPMFVLPYGIPATIDCQKRTLAIHEAAVT